MYGNLLIQTNHHQRCHCNPYSSSSPFIETNTRLHSILYRFFQLINNIDLIFYYFHLHNRHYIFSYRIQMLMDSCST